MYSGSDSTGSQNFNQWPLNPAAYQNTPNEQIDWAALAQQWIIMKEAGPPVPDQITAPLLPPNAQKVKKDNNLSEGGEAPMEVENDKEDDTQLHWNENNTTADSSWNWNQQQQWGWGNTWSAPSGVPPPGSAKTPLLPTPPSYNQYSTPTDGAANFGGYTRPPTNDYSGGYWTASGNKMKPHNKRYSKVNIPTRPPIATPATPDPVMLDATKRKQLPAWIREGLEKMERDKQKQLEKEREKLEKEDLVEKSKLNEKEALEIIKSTVKEREKSRFESDGEDSDAETNAKEKVREPPEPVVLSQEELMLKVRRTMTEILLKVTNQEIRAVCKEEFQRLLRKNKASDQRVAASSGTNISAKLGLGIYGDSGSSSGDSDGESVQEKDDSDMELKDTIKRRKAEFSKTEREIEERLAAAEKHVDDDSRGGTPKADDCDSQVDAKSQGYKSKSIEDSTPPKSILSSKRFKGRRQSSSSSTKSDSEHDKHDHKDRKVSRSKKSSSSESSRDQKSKRNKKSRSGKESRSITPERKRIKEKSRHSTDRKLKHSESSSSKSSSSRSRKSRSKSIDSIKKRRSRSTERYRRNSKNHKSSYSKRSHSRSSSRSRRSRSYTRSHRSESRSRRSRSYTKSDKSRRSRSRSRSDHSPNSRSHARSHRSRSRDRRSRSNNRSRRSHSRHRSKSYSPHSRRHRRSRSSSRGKRSHRH